AGRGLVLRFRSSHHFAVPRLRASDPGPPATLSGAGAMTGSATADQCAGDHAMGATLHSASLTKRWAFNNRTATTARASPMSRSMALATGWAPERRSAG